LRSAPDTIKQRPALLSQLFNFGILIVMMHEGTRVRPPRAGEGRPTALTPDVADLIVRIVRAGGYLESAAAAAGIARSTLYDYLRRGARDELGPYRAFAAAVRKAQADAEAVDVAVIGIAARTDWRAAAWRLSRRAPGRWGSVPSGDFLADVDGVAGDGEAGGVEAADPCALTDDDYAEAARLLTRRKRDREAAFRRTLVTDNQPGRTNVR
jgi:hypothetical protein